MQSPSTPTSDHVNNEDSIENSSPGQRERFDSRRKWTQEEDDKLHAAIKELGDEKWKKIADKVGTRNHVQCLQRWQKILKPGLTKGTWNVDEDALLVYLVSQGFCNWGKLAKHMPGRTSKQCRERWYHHLDPSVLKTDFTPEEDEIIMAQHGEYGNKWALISRSLPGRNENSVKIRFKALDRARSNGSSRIRKRSRDVRNALSLCGVDPLEISRKYLLLETSAAAATGLLHDQGSSLADVGASELSDASTELADCGIDDTSSNVRDDEDKNLPASGNQASLYQSVPKQSMSSSSSSLICFDQYMLIDPACTEVHFTAGNGHVPPATSTSPTSAVAAAVAASKPPS